MSEKERINIGAIVPVLPDAAERAFWSTLAQGGDDLGLRFDPDSPWLDGCIGRKGFFECGSQREEVSVIRGAPADMWALPDPSALTREPVVVPAASARVDEMLARAPIQAQPGNVPSEADLKKLKKPDLIKLFKGIFPTYEPAKPRKKPKRKAASEAAGLCCCLLSAANVVLFCHSAPSGTSTRSWTT